MSIDNELDLIGLLRIGHIVGLTLAEMKNELVPGMTTAELDAIGGACMARHGARSAPRIVYNFPGETCISINDEAAHGIPGPRVIQPGDLVNVDVSAELDGFFADAAITIPVPPVSAPLKALCDCTQQALEAGIAAAKMGQPINAIGRAVEQVAHRGGYTVIRELTGHGVGRHIHEPPTVPGFYSRQARQKLTKGLVITIEPFLTNGNNRVLTDADGWTLRSTDGSVSVQYEHTIVITDNEPLVVTAI